MCKIILPIKPEYAKRIIEGEKTYEYRKIQCRRDIDCILLYSTSPVKSIIGEVEVVGVLREPPISIWEKTKEFSGISKKKFFEYFDNATEAVAYKLGKAVAFDTPKDLSDYGIDYYPQSYVYVE